METEMGNLGIGASSSDVAQFNLVWARLGRLTAMSRDCGHALWRAVNALINGRINGSIAACGLGCGGASILIAQTLMQRGEARQLFLFDDFSASTVNQIRDSLLNIGYDLRLVRFVPGRPSEAVASVHTLNVALLHFDNASGEDVQVVLSKLYPRISRGGIMMLARYPDSTKLQKSVEGFFASESHASWPMLWPVDKASFGLIKYDDATSIEIDRYDYIPPGMTPPNLLHLFPFAKPENPWGVTWPYLRKEVPHIWRFDTRQTGYTTGNASMEEAACLYTFASQFAGKRGLEIGTHYGWTAAHLLAAGLRLDCIDPEFSDHMRFADVSAPLNQVIGSQGHRLWAGFSPNCLDEVRHSQAEPWSFAFIDGNHDGDSPRADAAAVLPYLAPDAMVMFHDMTSPHVEGGLNVYREAGFNVGVINTMQILGVAWRGNVVPPQHTQDPNVPYPWPVHLAKYPSL